MSYYTTLHSLNNLCLQQGWQLKRCRRQTDDQLRYYLVDSTGQPMMMRHRRMGCLLPDVATWLADNVSEPARSKADLLGMQLGYGGELYHHPHDAIEM